MFNYYINRFIKSPIYWCCMVVLACIMLLGCWGDLRNTNSLVYLWVVTDTVGIAHVTAPVLCALPFLYHYTMDMGNGVLYFQLVRNKKNRYCVGLLSAALWSSLSVAAGALLLFTAVCAMMGAGMSLNDSMRQYFENTGLWFLVCGDHVFTVYLLHCLAYILFALPWVLTGMLFTEVCKNSGYVTFAIPFLAQLALVYITEVLSLDKLNPNLLLLKGSELYTKLGGIWHTLFYVGVFCVLFSVLYVWVFYRRFSGEGI